MKEFIEYYKKRSTSLFFMMFDASKAFDIVNFWLLFDKLFTRSVSLFIIRILAVWYTHNKVCIRWGNVYSSSFSVSNSVKQGGILSLIRFKVYMDDLSVSLNSSNIGGRIGTIFLNYLCYADDLCLVSLSILEYWNIVKTKYMFYHSINKRVIYPKLKINHNNIERITQFNFLGVILHERMSWKQHIEHIRLKIAKTIGIIYRLKSMYPSAILLTLYNTLVTPHLHYCLLCWGSIIKENDLLHIMQKRVLRTITNSNYIAYTEPLFKELKLVKITDMYVIAIWKFYHKLMNNQLPMFFSSMTPQLPVACARYELRNPMSHLTIIKHKYVEKSIHYCLIRQLNSEVTWASTVEITKHGFHYVIRTIQNFN